MDNKTLFNLLSTCGLNCSINKLNTGFNIVRIVDNINNFDMELKRIFAILRKESIDYNSKYSEIKKSKLSISIFIPYQETKHQFLFDIGDNK
jgi:hypothetical protein